MSRGAGEQGCKDAGGLIGAEYNAKLEKAGTKLEDVHQVIPATRRLRWLEIEEIKATLDEACQIPRPQPKPIVA